MKKRHVFCLGHTSVDIFVHKKDLDNLRIGGTIISPNIHIQGGGDVANVAYWLGTLGANVSLIGVIAEDPAGFFIKNEFERVNVNCYFKTSIKNPTASILSVVEENGERSFIISGSSQDELTIEDIPFGEIKSGDLFYTSAYTIQKPPINQTILEILRKSKESNFKSFEVIFNLAAYNVVETHRPMLHEDILPYINILVGNFDEYSSLLQTNKSETEPFLLLDKIKANYQNIQLAILTDGSNGCYFITRSDRGSIPAINIEVIDSTGAGDGFCAGFILKYLTESDLRVALKSGISLSTHICQGFGARFNPKEFLEAQ